MFDNTLTVIVHALLPRIVPLVSAMVLPEAGAATAPPPQVVAPLGAVDVTSPGGRVSVSATLVSVSAFGLVIVIVNTDD